MDFLVKRPSVWTLKVQTLVCALQRKGRHISKLLSGKRIFYLQLALTICCDNLSEVLICIQQLF